jgi:Leucine-rich repeat (LRR) protein|tara:strand:+ start:174 stop:722 length:549 start_codon:yes stop_codon:yes gene_type:complete
VVAQNKQKALEELDSYLRYLFELKNPLGHPFDEWILILSNLHFFENDYPKSNTYPDGAIKFAALFSQMKRFKNEYIFVPKDCPTEYPFDNNQLKRMLNVNELTIGEPELGEIVRINHIEPLRHFHNLEELSICNNTVTTLLPIWNLPKLERIWIENTQIPIDERSRFRKDHPLCKLEDQVYL